VKRAIVFSAYYALLCILFSNSIYAIERTWTGNGTNDLWNNANNWAPVGVPMPGDSLFTFYTDYIKIPNGVDAEAKYFLLIGELIIESGGSLTIVNGSLEARGPITNKGVINISNSPKYGLGHSSQQSQNEVFINEGEIYIDNSALEGLFIRYDQTFTNRSGALIEVTNSGNENIRLQGTLQNVGTIRVNGSGTQIGMLIDSEDNTDPAFLSNDACSKITVRDQIVVQEGSVTNFGFFNQNYDGTNNIALAKFINLGFLEDIQKSFNVGHIDNNGIWLHKTTYPQFKTGNPIQIFDNHFSMPFTAGMSDVYNDRGLTSLAGTLDFETGIWTPNGNSALDSIFFVEASTISGGCLDTLRFDTGNKIIDVNYWTGGTGSWQFGLNWSKGSVPNSNENAGIFDVNAKVTMPLGYTADCKTLSINGQLTVILTSQLNIQGDTEGYGIDMKMGKLINNGVINLNNNYFGVYLEAAELFNYGTINCINNDFNFYLVERSDVISLLANHGNIDSNSGQLCIINNCVVQNFGSIIANIGTASYGISGDSLFNRGNIEIQGTGTMSGRGVDSYVYNDVNGHLEVRQLEFGLKVEGINKGVILVENTGTGFDLSDDFENKSVGSITVNNSTIGVANSSGKFTNENGGIISIDQCEIGMKVNNSISIDVFENQGEIQIANSSLHGIQCLGNLENENSGTIDITSTASHAIVIQAPSGDFFNTDNAVLTITQANGHGIHILGADLVNSDNAQIIINPTIMNHILLEPYNFFTTYNASLTNGAGILLRD